MGCDQHRRLCEKGRQRRVFVDQQVAGGRSHKNFYAADAAGVEAADYADVVVCGAEVERIVGRGYFCRTGEFLLQAFERNGGRIRIGHLHVRGDAAADRCRRLAADIGFVGHARLAEMHLVVDHARQHQFTAGVDHAGRDAGGSACFRPRCCSDFCPSSDFCLCAGVAARADTGDAVAFDDDISVETAPLVDECAVVDDDPVHSLFGKVMREVYAFVRGVILRKRSPSTPKSASRKMPLLILDAPKVRSVKMIGTSVTLNFSFHAVYFISTWKP